MSVIHQWAVRWSVPMAAIQDLQQRLGLLEIPMPDTGTSHPQSEAWVQSAVRLEATQKGMRLFRNNNGALKDAGGRLVRYGLANDSSAVNKVIKSGDLIGLRPILIGPHHVGYTIGQFVSREVKAADWHYTGTERELAQTNWMNLINSLGGDAAFANRVGTL